MVLDRIREWGSEPYKTLPKYDEKIVQLLLVSVYTAAGFIGTVTIDECARDFINGMDADIIANNIILISPALITNHLNIIIMFLDILRIRAEEDPIRMSMIGVYIEKYLAIHRG